MRVQYQLTFEDFKQAQQLLTRSRQNQLPPWWDRMLFLLIAMAIPVCVVFLFVLEAIFWPRPPGATVESLAGKAAPILVSLLPWILAQGLIWPFFCRILEPSARRSTRNLHLLLMLLLAAALTVSNLLSPVPEPTEKPAGFSSMLLTFAPFALVLAVYVLTTIRYLRDSVRRAWDGQQHLHASTVAEISEHTISLRNASSETLYRMTAFFRYRENDSLFMLFVGDLAFQLLPKRGFESTADIEQFRQWLDAGVGSSAARGFAVETISTPLPPPLPNATRQT